MLRAALRLQSSSAPRWSRLLTDSARLLNCRRDPGGGERAQGWSEPGAGDVGPDQGCNAS
eukprot:1766293-Rhodomonas_salina.4